MIDREKIILILTVMLLASMAIGIANATTWVYEGVQCGGTSSASGLSGGVGGTAVANQLSSWSAAVRASVPEVPNTSICYDYIITQGGYYSQDNGFVLCRKPQG